MILKTVVVVDLMQMIMSMRAYLFLCNTREYKHLVRRSRSCNIDRSKPKSNAYSSYMTTQKECTSTITNKNRKAQRQQNSACKNVLFAIEQYVSNLKLPFEIFIITCMIVLMQGCIPILKKLLPKVIMSHKFFLELSGVVIVIGTILWYLVRTNNRHGHVGLWTGASLRHWGLIMVEERCSCIAVRRLTRLD
jgi:hypothetical protein